MTENSNRHVKTDCLDHEGLFQDHDGHHGDDNQSIIPLLHLSPLPSSIITQKDPDGFPVIQLTGVSLLQHADGKPVMHVTIVTPVQDAELHFLPFELIRRSDLTSRIPKSIRNESYINCNT